MGRRHAAPIASDTIARMNPSLTTRDRLLRAAVEVFAAHGYAGASVRDICALARANPGAVSYHFGGKRHLYRAAVRAATEELAALAGADVSGGDPLARLAGGIATELEHRPTLARLLLRDLADGGEAAREALVPALRRAVDRATAAAGAEADPAAGAALRRRAAPLLAAAIALPLLWPLVREAAGIAAGDPADTLEELAGRAGAPPR